MHSNSETSEQYQYASFFTGLSRQHGTARATYFGSVKKIHMQPSWLRPLSWSPKKDCWNQSHKIHVVGPTTREKNHKCASSLPTSLRDGFLSIDIELNFCLWCKLQYSSMRVWKYVCQLAEKSCIVENMMVKRGHRWWTPVSWFTSPSWTKWSRTFKLNECSLMPVFYLQREMSIVGMCEIHIRLSVFISYRHNQSSQQKLGSLIHTDFMT
jgi:hypothetical protein